MAVARRRVHHRHRRHRLQRLLQALAAARDDQVDQALRGRQLGRARRGRRRRAARPPLGQPGLGDRLAHERRQRAVGALRVARAAQHDRVAALQASARRSRRSRSAAPRRRPRSRRAAPAPCCSSRPLASVRSLELLADRVRQRGDRRARPSAIAATRSASSASRSRSASSSPAARSSARSAAFASRISSAALAEQLGEPLQSARPWSRSWRSTARASPLGGRADLGDRPGGVAMLTG